MLEQKLIVGRFINLNIPLIVPAYGVGAFVSVHPQQFYLQQSTGFQTKTSNVQAGFGAKAHRNFVWLPWLTGAISEVALVGADVLTGPMSGCWLVSYRKPTGVPYAGHLGTDIGVPANTAAVKATWNGFANAQPGDVIGGFNPFNNWVGPIPGNVPGDTAARFFGLFTTTHQYYSVCAYQQLNSAALFRIAGIQQVPSAPLATLQAV